MCGRYAVYSGLSVYADLFRMAGIDVPDWWPRYNIKPTNQVLAVRQEEGELRAGSMRWGLVPSWWKKPVAEMKAATFNAVGEEVHEKPMYRAAWKQRKRCLVAADNLYEWETAGKEKLPWLIRRRDGPSLRPPRSESDRLRGGLIRSILQSPTSGSGPG